MTTDQIKKFCILLLLAVIAIGIMGNKEEEPGTSEALNTAPNIIFLLADDWSYPHAGAYGDATVRTLVFDFLAKEGALFKNAYCAATPYSSSRAKAMI